MQPKKIKISQVSFQAAVSAPGLLPGTATLSSNKYKTKDFSMVLESGLLHIRLDGKLILVTLTNIKAMMVEEE